jgi:UDP-N-acetylmuramoylalanine-D-glutamate ligase
MIKNKNILVVGGGNAGRPVANLFNFLGNNVVVNDINTIEKFPKESQKQIKILKKRNIKFELGSHDIIDLNSFDHVFISPNIPENIDFIKKIRDYIDNGKLTIITFKDFGNILDSLINIPLIGITGADGKTTTTNMINFILKEKFSTVFFSSIESIFVIEGLAEMIIRNHSQKDDKAQENHKKINNTEKINGAENIKKGCDVLGNKNNLGEDIGIFELPHGTLRLVEGLKLSAAVLTNLNPDHMEEFNSFEDYINRHIAIEKLIKKDGIFIVNGDDPIISLRLDSFSSKTIVYGLKLPQKIEFENEIFYNEDVNYDIVAENIELNAMNGSTFTIRSDGFDTLICKNCNEINCSCGNFEPIYLEPFEKEIFISFPGLCNVENVLSTLTSSIIFGLDLDYAISRISTFNGLNGRFEKIGILNGVNIFIDGVHNPESFEKFLSGLDISGRLIVSLDNPNTTVNRDKKKIGEILSKYSNVLIASAKNETKEVIDYDGALEVIEGAKDIETYITNTVSASMFKALEIANKGDTVFHLGPGLLTSYDNVKSGVLEAIEFFKSLSTNIFVIGGCGTVGSLMARILKSHNYDVIVTDISTDCKLKEVFKEEGIKLSLGKFDKELLKNASSFFIAPSLMENKKILNQLKEISNVPIYGVNEILKFFKSYKHVFGVTGTNGKTSTVNYLKTILKKAGLKVPEHKLNIQGNNEFIPALQARLGGDLAVIEIGTFGNKGEIKTASENSGLTTGIITNISKDHIQKDFNDYIACKKEILQVARNLIINADDPILNSFADLTSENNLKSNGNILFFGVDGRSIDDKFNDFFKNKFDKELKCPNCDKKLDYFDNTSYICSCGFKKPKLDVKATDVKIVKDENNRNIITYILNVGEKQGQIYLRNSSIVNVYNSLAAATGAYLEGICFEVIVDGINSFEGVPGRFEILHENPLIILDYAHNPSGLKSIIQGVLAIKEDLKSDINASNEKITDNNLNNSSKLIIVNTISSESGDDGDKEIAILLSDGDIVIPVSNQALTFSKYIQSEVIPLENKVKYEKTNITGATKEQVEEGIKIALNQAKDKDILLIIGEAGTKYSKDILNQLL